MKPLVTAIAFGFGVATADGLSLIKVERSVVISSTVVIASGLILLKEED